MQQNDYEVDVWKKLAYTKILENSYEIYIISYKLEGYLCKYHNYSHKHHTSRTISKIIHTVSYDWYKLYSSCGNLHILNILVLL